MSDLSAASPSRRELRPGQRSRRRRRRRLCFVSLSSFGGLALRSQIGRGSWGLHRGNLVEPGLPRAFHRNLHVVDVRIRRSCVLRVVPKWCRASMTSNCGSSCPLPRAAGSIPRGIGRSSAQAESEAATIRAASRQLKRPVGFTSRSNCH